MRVLLITAMAWTAGASAFDIPAGALHQTQICTTTTKGAIYSANSVLEGTIAPDAKSQSDRYTWTEGKTEYIVTKGNRTGDGSAAVETYTQRNTEREGDVEHETLVMTTQTKSGFFGDALTTYETNEYKIVGEDKILQSRVVNKYENVNVKETINDHPTPTGRVVTTRLVGPYMQKLSDDTGQYATIETQDRNCTMYNAG